ncbi:MAG: hypothetical protein E7484_07290 [Ruminococcaceae bacterium]|nr:hypothetical protein [Oscillospiraceae bacterium]
MKYVSPQTEKRKQRQRKRKKQLLLGICLLAAIVVVAVAVIAFTGRDKPPQSSSEQNSISSGTTIQEESSSAAENEDSSQEENSSSENVNSSAQDTSSQGNNTDSSSGKNEQQAAVVNPHLKNKSIIDKIKGIFSKEEIQPAFPAMSFGVQIDQAADSIISLSPLATEVILSSPSQHNLVAVSEYCNKRGNQFMTVGTPLIPKTDKIIQLAPDYLIVQTPLGEQDKIKIQQSGITVLQLNAPKNLDDLKEIYRSVTALTKGAQGATDFSERLYSDLEGKLSLYKAALSQISKKSAVMLFNSYGMVATADTFEGEILSAFFDITIEGKNYFAENIEKIAASDPQVLIVPDFITASQLEQLGFGQTKAYLDGNVYYVNMQDFENISAKSIKILAGIANSVYGDSIQPVPTASPEAE